MKKISRNYLTLLGLLFTLIVFPASLFAEGASNTPSVSISPTTATVVEGDSGTKTLNFTVTISECPDTLPVKIRIKTRNGSANAGSDYITFDTAVQFDATLGCTTSIPVSIQVNGDTIFEGDEVFYLDVLNNGTHTDQTFSFGPKTSTITITGDDTNPNANLRITKTNDISPNRVVLGDQILYTIVATNDGPQSSTIQVTDTIPGGLSFDSVSDNSSDFSCSHAGGTVTCSGSRNFAAGESVTISVLADVDAYDANNAIDLYRNTAHVSSTAGKPDENPSNNTATSDVRIHKIDLRVTKSTSTPTVANIGDPIVFTLTARNQKPQESTISLTDTLPAGMTLVSVTITSGPSDFSCNADLGTNTVTCGGTHEFEPGDVATITINATAAANGRHYNTATVTSPEGYPESTTNNNSDNAYVDIGAVVTNDIINASKTVSPPADTVTYWVGDTVTFTMQAENRGVPTQVRIIDWFNTNGSTNGAFEFVSVTDGAGVPMNCSNSGSTWAQCFSQSILVPSGSLFTMIVQVKLKKVGNVCNRGHFYKGYPDSGGGTQWTRHAYDTVCFNVQAHEAPPVLNATNFNITPDVAITPIDLKTVTTDPDTPTSDLVYSGATGLPLGLSMDASGVISGTYVHPGRGPVHAPFTVTVTVTDPEGLTDTDSFTITLVPPTIQANHNAYRVPILSTFSGNLITEVTTAWWGTVYQADEGVDLQVTNIIDSSLNPSTLTWASNGDFTYDTNTTAPNTFDIYLYTIEDKYGQSDQGFFLALLYTPPIGATDDNYATGKNTPLSGNVLTDNTGNGSDFGDGIHIISNTTTSNGSLTLNNDGTFTYNPNLNYTGNDSFTYGITDNYGQESNATVTIIVGAVFIQGYTDFALVNPPNTRNIIGNFISTGNTVQCVTDKLGDANESNSFNGACTNNPTINNNNRMTRYIDIDGNVTAKGQSTWNSSSSTFTLPANYDQQGGLGIAWAALFWQGSINNKSFFKQRRAYPTGGTYAYKEITTNEIIDLGTSGANEILVQIDGALSYTPIESDTFYNDLIHTVGGTNFGGYYAAYANITTLLQSYNLAAGNHTFTVANIISNEGREHIVGNYAGWTLVIIYKEDVANGKPRNISIYNGYQAIGNGGTSSVSSKEITISGFKLPKAGDVNASISAFVGEGEKIYGGSPLVYDTMIVKDLNGTSFSIPTADPNNIFDATLAGVTRAIGNDNNINNTNGIDVDAYDISSAMTTMRDHDTNVSSLIIGIASLDTNLADGDDSDYVTASMLAFSAELYKPQICYDYTLDLDGYILESSDNEIKTTFGDQGTPLTTRVSIKSEEGDFVLRDVNISYSIVNTAQVKYVTDSVAIAPNGIYSYIPAGTTGLNQAYNQTMNGFGLYIGEGANSVPGPGGSIDAFETRYIRFDGNLETPDIDTKFDLSMNYLINYGSGDLALTHSFDQTQLCDGTGIYNPARGIFNVTSHQADDGTGMDYNLFTQIAQRDFRVKVFSYDTDYTTLIDVDNSVEIEMFNAGNFERDINVSCYNPDGNITSPIFVNFENESMKSIPNIRYDGAIRNTGFRIWYLLKPDGSTAENNCTSRTTPANCFNDLYSAEYPADTFCNTECQPANTQCYPCLRKYYGKPICSRDNFSVRPEAFVTAVIDSQQDVDTSAATQIPLANSKSPTPLNLVAGYAYRFDINATTYLGDTGTRGYHQYFNQSQNANYAKMDWHPGTNTVTGCNDINEHNISTLLFNGSSVSGTNAQVEIVTQVGQYEFKLRDENWTAVDWLDTLTTHHSASGFDGGDDCTLDGVVTIKNNGLKQGCYVDSIHTHPDGLGSYQELVTRYYPDRFNLSGLSIGAGPTLARNFVYVNTLDGNYPLSGDEDMSYNIVGSVAAVGYNDESLTNFVRDCYAENVNLSLTYTFLGADAAAIQPFTYDLENRDTIQNIQTSKIQNTLANAVALGSPAIATITQNASQFIKEMNGSLYVDLGFNFNKNNSVPNNPRRIQFTEFNTSYAIQPAALSVDGLTTPHRIENNTTIDIANNIINFYYAKIRPSQTFYDDITGMTVTTPISVSIYCDPVLTNCPLRGIPLASRTNEFNWWTATQHNNDVQQRDGNVVFQAPASSTLSTQLPPVVNGVNAALTLTRDANATLPLTVPVNLETNIAGVNYTDRWLIHTPTGVALPLYKARFIGTGTWSGVGQTGNVVGDTISDRKSQRIER